MKKCLLFAICFISFLIKAENNIESFNVISDNYYSEIHDTPIVRSINGGTVINPIFDESCPEYLKAPFSYACKIMEEYLPPCLPLKVKVSCGRVNSSSNSISKVLARGKENFGVSVNYKNATMSTIKGVILAEYCAGSTITYLDSVPDINFLIDDPDIEITYNENKLDEISFSLEPEPGNNFDFVSLAIRDLLIGLGFTSSFRSNPINGELLDPSHEFIPFESCINRMLGNYDDPKARFEQATKGELILKNTTYQLSLYAPSVWKNGLSLNYFIPQEDCCISKILTYDFCKGMVTRAISDEYDSFIFTELLGWRANVLTSTGGTSLSSEGNTSWLMPYNGSITMNSSELGVSAVECSSNIQLKTKGNNWEDNDSLKTYIESFHPFIYIKNSLPANGVSICILKKDGSWDLVQSFAFCDPDMTFNMSDWTFHFDEDQYARTIDGYLRARITTKEINNLGRSVFKSMFFVIDYLPQKVSLSYSFINTTNEQSTQSTLASIPVRIYFSNLEGINRVVLERLRQGARVPSKIDVYDFKKGYFDTTIDRTTTFTAVGYNDNGTSRGLPIVLNIQTSDASLNFKLEDSVIHIDSQNDNIETYNYYITSIDGQPQAVQNGVTKGTIDVSSIGKGLYNLTVVSQDTGCNNSFKFKLQ